MEEQDREIWVGENRIYLGEDNIIHITILGEVDEEIQIGINEACYKLINMVEGRVDSLVDLNKAGKQSPKARKLGIEIIEHEKVGKLALFGLHPVARVVASFFLGFTRKKDLRFFKTREEALTWLKE